MLSHVLARRKHMSMETLVRALDRIGYDLRVVPRADGCDRPNDPVEAEACVLAH
jgi:hypothetical protein